MEAQRLDVWSKDNETSQTPSKEVYRDTISVIVVDEAQLGAGASQPTYKTITTIKAITIIITTKNSHH